MSLTTKQYAEAKGLDPQWLTENTNVTDGVFNNEPCVDIPYFDQKGKHLFDRKRTAISISPEEKKSGKRKFYQPAGIGTHIYGLNRLKDYTGTAVALVEGESDAHTLWQHGIPALAIPGANNWKEEWVQYFDQFDDVYVVKEPDQGGDELEKKMLSSAMKAKVSVMTLGEFKDVSEMHLNDPSQFLTRWNKAASESNPLVPMPEMKGLDALLKQELPPVEFTVENLLPEGAITIMSGPPASYKTFLAFDIARQVASGGKLWGQFQTKPGRVGIIDEEGGERLIHQRFHYLRDQDDPENTWAKNIDYLDFSGFTFEQTDQMIRALRKRGINLVIFDSLIRFLGGADENDSVAMANVMKSIKSIANSGITVLVLHHHRKQGLIKDDGPEAMRGSSDILASINSHLTASHDSKKGYITIKQHKLREAEPVEPFVLNMTRDDANEHTSFSYGGKLDEQKSQADEAEEVVRQEIDAIHPGDDIAQTELIDKVSSALGCSPKPVRQAIKKLESEGYITKKTKPGRGQTRFISPVREYDEDEDSAGELL